MQTPAIGDSVTLYFREGPSDKVYQAAIEPRGDGFVVTFAFGRRGGTLQAGVKTPPPVSYATARKVYDRLVGDKTAKGYTPGAGGTPSPQTPDEARVSGVLPQLLNPVDETEAEQLLADPRWWAQPKFDGRRLLIRKSGSEVVGDPSTAPAFSVGGLPEPVVVAVRAVVAGSCLLDGEAIGDVYHCFDLLEQDGPVSTRPAVHRAYFRGGGPGRPHGQRDVVRTAPRRPPQPRPSGRCWSRAPADGRAGGGGVRVILRALHHRPARQRRHAAEVEVHRVRLLHRRGRERLQTERPPGAARCRAGAAGRGRQRDRPAQPVDSKTGRGRRGPLPLRPPQRREPLPAGLPRPAGRRRPGGLHDGAAEVQAPRAAGTGRATKESGPVIRRSRSASRRRC